jgi:hypothetical protein
VLVAGQSTGSQNGLYQVSVLGTGSNGTWIRSVDANQTGEIDAGMIVMVTEGDIYKDTQWKLTTNDPIVIGTTALTFEQNSAFAFGNIFANGTAVLADIVGDTVTFTPADNFTITANAASDTITFAVSQSPTFTGNVSGSNLSTAGQVTATGNVTGSNLITAGLGSFGTTISATGNITGGNLVSNARIDGANLYLTSLDANKVVFTGANGQLIDSQNFTFDGVTANIQGALIVDSIEIDSNSVSSTVGNLLLEAPLGSFVSIPGNLLIDGLITGNLLPSANVTYNLGSPTQRWKEVFLAGNTIDIGGATISADLETGSLVLKGPDGAEFILTGSSPTDSFGIFGLIEAGNASPATSTTTGALRVVGGAGIGGNIFAGGIVDIAGNSIYLGNLVLKDNGSNIFGLYAADGVTPATISQTSVDTTKISNGTSNVQVVSANSNVTVSIGGTANVLVVSTAGANVLGTLGVSGNITGGNLLGGLVTGTLTTAAQPNVTSVGTLTSVSVTGNVSGGNLVTTGTVSTGTLTTSGNATIAGNLTVSGNVISVNVTDLNVVDPIIGLGRGANNTPLTTNDGKDRGEQLWYYTTSEQSAFIGYDNSTGKLIAATNVSVASEVVTVNNYGNLVIGGLESATISATGNANVGNLGTAGQITATGNITGGNLITAGNITGNYLLANITFASGYNTTKLFNGTSEANIGASGGNLAITIGGTSNVMVVSAGGAAVTGTLTSSGNSNVGNLGTAGQITATGNVSASNYNLSGNIVDTGALTLITGASGNITLAPNGINVIIATTTGANITGTINATGNANVGNLGTAGQITVTGNVTAVGNISGGNILGNGFNLSGISAFKTVAVTAGNSVVADSIADTLTFTAGSGITIIASPDTDTITIAAASAGSDIFVDGADFGTVDETVTLQDDLGLITEALDTQVDLGEIVTSGVFYPNQLVLPSFTVSTLPSATVPAQMIYVSNATGGAITAFSDGTNWRRTSDRSVIN